jgi:SAM-dependent methyltransferase/predicted NBD/HSP70 family sugar kinase
MVLGLERGPGERARMDLEIFPAGPDHDRDNLRHVSWMLDLLLHARGGWRIHLGGPRDFCSRLAHEYLATRTLAARVVAQAYGRVLEARIVASEEVPAARTAPLGRVGGLEGCRVGFDLGASSIKVAALVDGRVVFSADRPWDPKGQCDPAYHEGRIREGLELAASHLPRVDAIGGCASGILVDNEIRMSALFHGVPEGLALTRARSIFRRMEAAWGVPFVVRGDGEVMALAAGRGGVMAIGLGSGEAAGCLDREGRVAGWLNELGSAPLGAADPGEEGFRTGAACLSQEAVDRLARRAGLPVEASLPLPERVRAVQALAGQGDATALEVFETVGAYLGHALPWYGEVYDADRVLVGGGVTFGAAGARILLGARKVLAAQYGGGPALELMDEAGGRVGLCMAAARLPGTGPHGAPARESRLERLVAALPEVYQPIFGLSAGACRPCEDRLAQVSRIYLMLAQKLGRPLRVLDLGCAQGFFSFSLARLGATVFGVDSREANIEVCRALAESHPGPTFHLGFVELALAGLGPGQFDLVLGLSVLHHLVNQSGPAPVRELLAQVARHVPAGVFELALASEPASWARALPEDPRSLLDGFAFVHECARHIAHHADVSRPLYFASDRFWLLGDSLEGFDQWGSDADRPGGSISGGTRRCYSGHGLLAKCATLTPDHGEANLRSHAREVAYLEGLPPGVPRLLQHGRNAQEAWLVREEVSGRTLSSIIQSGGSYDADRILEDILDQLVSLEAAGLHHEDLRAWNIIIGPGGRATLVDYGAIGPEPEDWEWPHHLLFSFMILVDEVTSRQLVEPYPIRAHSLDPDRLDEPWRSAFLALFAMPVRAWRFRVIRDRLRGGPAEPLPEGLGLALRTLEDALEIYKCAITLGGRP